MIEFIREAGSTNGELAGRLRAGASVPEGCWLVADRQSAGRGRQGREWADGSGNFMGSTVVHLRGGDPPAATLALVAGLAAWQVIAGRLLADTAALLKWPNDVMVSDAKLAGILLERIGDAIVIGIGVNLVAAPAIAGRRTVCLAELGAAAERDGFADDLAAALALELDRWRAFGVAPIVERWQRAAHPIGTPLAVGEPGEVPLAGVFAGLTADGALQLRVADGTTHIITAGEVRLAGPIK